MKDIAVETFERDGGTVEVSDLYGAEFDPLEGPDKYTSRKNSGRFEAQAEQRHAWETGTISADVREEIEKLKRAELVVFQYPLWWYGPPAILKGWFDRIFVYGGLYRSDMRYDKGYFRGKRAMLSISTGAPESTYAYNGRNADIELLLWPTNFTLYYMGFTILPPFIAFGVEGELKYSDPEIIKNRLEGFKGRFRDRLRRLDSLEPMRFNGWDDWDDEGRLKSGVQGFSHFMRAEP
jgi:NAD(P)H dehydrogenase (quinone)